VAAHAKIEIQIHSPNACIVTLRGEHDASSSEAVTLALAAARNYGNILIDLGECTFVDSSLISALLVAAQRARELGGALALALPAEADAVRRTLEIANIQMILPFHATREAGLASIEASKPAQRARSELCSLSAKIDQMQTRAELKRTTAKRAGSLILRAQVVVDSVDVNETWDEKAA
jgi:anti-anti-sigma factor